MFSYIVFVHKMFSYILFFYTLFINLFKNSFFFILCDNYLLGYNKLYFRSTLNNNTGVISKQKNDAGNGGKEKEERKEKEEGKEKDNKILTIQPLQQSPKPRQKFSPKFGKRFSPKFSRNEKKSGIF